MSSAPYRVSFIGGGTDTPESCEYHDGMVVSAAIDKYIHVLVNKKTLENNYRVAYKYDVEEVESIPEIKHNLVRDCLYYYSDHKDFLEIVTVGDVPGRGTGLGSSSALTVALLSALSMMYANSPPFCIPEVAFYIERKYSKLGRQDQYASYLGGMRSYRFHKSGAVEFSEWLPRPWRNMLENNMILRYVGVASENTNAILHEQSKSNLEYSSVVMSNLASKFADYLNDNLNNYTYHACLDLIDESWEIKKLYSSNICTEKVAQCISDMKELGCKGLKVLGSGGGGFVMGFHPIRQVVKEELGGEYLDVKLQGAINTHICG